MTAAKKNMDYFWNGIPVLRLSAAADDVIVRAVTRAGVLPFYVPPHGPCEFLFMTPRPKNGLAPPKDQIAKGGRQVKINGVWRDMEDRSIDASTLEMEPVAATAMREGREEIGLLPENVTRLYDIGPVEFISEKKKIPTKMYLFAAQVKTKENFERVEGARWMTLDAFLKEGREDHRKIVERAWVEIQPTIGSSLSR